MQTELERLVADYRAKRDLVRAARARSMDGGLIGGINNQALNEQQAAAYRLANYLADRGD